MEKLLYAALLTPAWIYGEGYAAYKGPLGLPLAVHGPPGCGKSAMFSSLARETGMLHYAFPIESCETEDLNGIVVRHPSGYLERLSDNQEVLEMIEVGEGIIVLDELNSNRALSAAVNRIIYERMWCRRILPPGIRIFATLNPPHLSAGGRVLPSSQANRLCHIEYEMSSPDNWVERLAQDPADRTPLQLKDLRSQMETHFDRERSQLLMAIHAFMQTNPTFLQVTPAAGSPDISGAYPSPRTWHLALNALATCSVLGFQDVKVSFAEGLLGKKIAEAFLQYLMAADLPPLHTVVSGGWSPNARRLDIMYAVMQSVRQYVDSTTYRALPEADKVGQAMHILKVCEDMLAAEGKDLVTGVVKSLCKHFPVSLLSGPAHLRPVVSKILRISQGMDVRLYREAAP